MRDSKNIKPLTPEEAGLGKIKLFPNFVIQAFNELIIRNLIRNISSFRQGDVVARIKELCNEKPFDFWWLNVEELYRTYGWNVEREYNETGSISFTFTAKVLS